MVELAHKIIGSGEKKVLFLHELMGDSRNYEKTIPYLDTTNYTFIFVDLRGYGSSKEIKGSYTCDEAAQDLKNLITNLNLNEVFLVAHSMSTMIAQKIALIDNRIKKLVLVTPISAEGIKMKDEAKKTMIAQLNENSGKIEEIVNSASKRYNQTWKDYRIDIAYTSSILEARVGYMSMYLNTDFLEDAEESINIPIKIIVGKYDFPVFAKANIQKIFSAYKDVQIVECQESGHYPMIECPVYFASKIEEFCK
ncbi:MAG: alpha/beta fold hydrolase [Halarcobacter sp.]